MKKSTLLLAAFLFGISAWNLSSAAPKICTMDYNPVCGTDGKTYGNACGAAAAEVPVAYAGECAATPVTTAAPTLGLRPLEIGNGTPFSSVFERNRIQRYVVSHIAQLVTNGAISEGKVTVTKISWGTVDQKRPRLMKVAYRMGGKRFEESFVAATDGNRVLVLPAVTSGKEFTLRKGQKAYAYESGVTIELADLSDSRCPSGVQCIWAGEAALQMRYVRQWGESTEWKNLLAAFGLELEVKKSDYRTYAKFHVK